VHINAHLTIIIHLSACYGTVNNFKVYKFNIIWQKKRFIFLLIIITFIILSFIIISFSCIYVVNFLLQRYDKINIFISFIILI